MLTRGLFETIGLRIHKHTNSGTGGDTLDGTTIINSQGVTTSDQHDIEAGGSLIADRAILLKTQVANSISVDQNNYVPFVSATRKSVLALTCTGGTRTITGFSIVAATGLQDGQLWIINVLSNSLILKHASALSASGNRIFCPNATDLTIPAGGSVLLLINTSIDSDNPVRVIGVAGTSGSALADHTHSASGDGGNSLLPDTVDIASSLRSDQFLEIGGQAYGHAQFASPAAGSYNNVSLITTFGGAYPVMLLTPAGNVTWTGIDITDFDLTKGVPLICLVNGATVASALSWTIKDASASSTAANRYKGNGTDLVLAPGQAVWLTYDSNSIRWVSIDGPAGGATVGTLLAANNLSDVTSEVTSRFNLGIQGARVNISAPAASVTDVTLNWPTAFPDTNYSVTVSYFENGFSGGTAIISSSIYAIAAGSIQVRFTNATTATRNGFIHAVAVHD